MIQLRPTEQFTIVRVLGDTQDSATYYVRAVVRNSNTDTIIETIDLTDQGSRRFTKGWEIPADVSGEGFYIDITTTVYTDSGYTTNAGDYAEEVNTYLVQDRYNRTFGLGGGGIDIDYKKLRRIVKDEIKTIIIPEQEKVNLSSIESGVRRIISQNENIKFPKQIETNLEGVITAIKEAKSAIDNKHIPTPERLNLTPAIENSNKNNKELLSSTSAMFSEIVREMQNDKKESLKTINELKSKFDLTSKMRTLFNEANDEFKEEEKPKKKRVFTKR